MTAAHPANSTTRLEPKKICTAPPPPPGARATTSEIFAAAITPMSRFTTTQPSEKAPRSRPGPGRSGLYPSTIGVLVKAGHTSQRCRLLETRLICVGSDLGNQHRIIGLNAPTCNQGSKQSSQDESQQ